MGLSGVGTELNVHILMFYLSPLLYTIWKSIHKWLVSTMLMTYVSMHNIQWNIFHFNELEHFEDARVRLEFRHLILL